MAKKITLNTIELFLMPQKCVFIPQYQLLVISDWHLGKLSHFRKEGLFIPQNKVQLELEQLGELLQELPVRKVVFLGDLFHSDFNHDWDAFISYISTFPHVEFVLTKGNHDILPDFIWKQNTIIKQQEYVLLAEGLLLSHEPLPDLPAYMYNMVGHIHPGCVMETKGRQRFRLPCYYLRDSVLTLPAFGKYTGLHIVSKDDNAQIFAIVNDVVLEI